MGTRIITIKLKRFQINRFDQENNVQCFARREYKQPIRTVPSAARAYRRLRPNDGAATTVRVKHYRPRAPRPRNDDF